MAEKTLNYTEAFEELQGILEQIEEGSISLDELSVQVKRATILIDICKKKLTSTEDDVAKILEQLKEDKAS